MFDEQPDGDQHGECAAEIHRLQAENTKFRAVFADIFSVRDQFAAKAMQAAATNPKGADGFTFDERAQWAYEQADAMMRARTGLVESYGQHGPTPAPDWHPCRDMDGATCADQDECASGCVRFRAPGGMAKDAARYRWLRGRFLGADFEWRSGESPARTVLLFDWNRSTVWGDLDLTIDSVAAAASLRKAGETP